MTRLFIFRRDLRIVDNLGLAACCAEAAAEVVLPVFIFNPRQVDPARNPYHSVRAVDFMVRCLLDLGRALPELRLLRTATGDDLDVIAGIHSVTPLRAIHFNADTTPFARERDRAIAAWCASAGIECVPCDAEYSLVPPGAMPKPYQRFTPFWRRHLDEAAANAAATSSAPINSSRRRRRQRRIFAACPAAEVEAAKGAWVRSLLLPRPSAGSRSMRTRREQALGVLQKIRTGGFADYAVTRDDLGDAGGTTGLSEYLKFGCVSVREAFRAVEAAHGRTHELARQLMWRAFYDQVAYHFPGVLRGQVSKEPNETQQRNVAAAESWAAPPGSSAAFDAWCAGTTGVPLVDAGMRQLAATGRMHNRLRMVVAVYLTRTLRIDWRLGERFFATRLVDYHPAANNGGWQWASGGGADALPSFRTISPYRQAERHDPQRLYRQAWGP